MKTILLTGGTGYIGSHTAIQLLENGDRVVLVDNLINSSGEVIEAINTITGKQPLFFQADVRNYTELKKIFVETKPDAVIHFAAFKAVGESVAQPLMYYQNNLEALMNVMRVMKECAVPYLVFSSSATVYGNPTTLPIQEDFPLTAESPYAFTKLMAEQIIRDEAHSNPHFFFGILRYFNPVGAHPSGLVGENPNGIPNNLMPFIVQVAAGMRERLNVFGGDYDTKDGTCIRDYIHVDDLARGHSDTLRYMIQNNSSVTLNLGSGKGLSVLDIVNAFTRVNKVAVPYVITDRRPGDVPEYYADPTLAYQLLGWQTKKTVEDMVRDSWNWQKNQLKTK